MCKTKQLTLPGVAGTIFLGWGLICVSYICCLFRFWYEREGIFTSEQLVTIQQTSIASAICESSDSITRVQKDVFLLAVDDDDYVPCNEIPKLDLNQWTDCCEGILCCESCSVYSSPEII